MSRLTDEQRTWCEQHLPNAYRLAFSLPHGRSLRQDERESAAHDGVVAAALAYDRAKGDGSGLLVKLVALALCEQRMHRGPVSVPRDYLARPMGRRTNRAPGYALAHKALSRSDDWESIIATRPCSRRPDPAEAAQRAEIWAAGEAYAKARELIASGDYLTVGAAAEGLSKSTLRDRLRRAFSIHALSEVAASTRR